MKRRVTPSLVVSVIALIVALGGASYAAIKLPKNSVGTKQIRNKAVNSKKVKDGSLLLRDFKAGQVKPNAYIGSREPSPPFPIPASPTFGLVTETDTKLPPGNYLLLGRANVFASGPTDSSVTCALGNSADVAQAISVPAGEAVPFSLSGVANLTTAVKQPLVCLRSGGTASVAQASITAVPINKVIGTP